MSPLEIQIQSIEACENLNTLAQAATNLGATRGVASWADSSVLISPEQAALQKAIYSKFEKIILKQYGPQAPENLSKRFGEWASRIMKGRGIIQQGINAMPALGVERAFMPLLIELPKLPAGQFNEEIQYLFNSWPSTDDEDYAIFRQLLSTILSNPPSNWNPSYLVPITDVSLKDFIIEETTIVPLEDAIEKYHNIGIGVFDPLFAKFRSFTPEQFIEKIQTLFNFWPRKRDNDLIIFRQLLERILLDRPKKLTDKDLKYLTNAGLKDWIVEIVHSVPERKHANS